MHIIASYMNSRGFTPKRSENGHNHWFPQTIFPANRHPSDVPVYLAHRPLKFGRPAVQISVPGLSLSRLGIYLCLLDHDGFDPGERGGHHAVETLPDLARRLEMVSDHSAPAGASNSIHRIELPHCKDTDRFQRSVCIPDLWSCRESAPALSAVSPLRCHHQWRGNGLAGLCIAASAGEIQCADFLIDSWSHLGSLASPEIFA